MCLDHIASVPLMAEDCRAVLQLQCSYAVHLSSTPRSFFLSYFNEEAMKTIYTVNYVNDRCGLSLSHVPGFCAGTTDDIIRLSDTPLSDVSESNIMIDGGDYFSGVMQNDSPQGRYCSYDRWHSDGQIYVNTVPISCPSRCTIIGQIYWYSAPRSEGACNRWYHIGLSDTPLLVVPKWNIMIDRGDYLSGE